MAISTERKTSIHELADHGQSLWLDNLTLVRPGVYGDDRLFTYIRMQQDGEHPGITSLERAGQPVVGLGAAIGVGTC